MSISERMVRVFNEAANAKGELASHKAICEFGSAFLDSMYLVTDGDLWKNSWVRLSVTPTKEGGLPNGTYFNLVTVPSQKKDTPNKSIITLTNESNQPEVAAHLILETSFNEQGGHKVEQYMLYVRGKWRCRF